MDFEEWEPIYQCIVDEFGYSRQADEEAARLLDRLLSKRDIYPLGLLQERLSAGGIVCGDALRLEEDLSRADLSGTVIAADGATSVLMHTAGRIPDVIVTDLDGDITDQITANAQGAIVIVHAHGDNMKALRRHVPGFPGKIMGTTQVRPFGRLHNFGGFTDGDRAVLMVRHMGGTARLIGFDPDTPRPKRGRDPRVKMRKLIWAYWLIEKYG